MPHWPCNSPQQSVCCILPVGTCSSLTQAWACCGAQGTSLFSPQLQTQPWVSNSRVCWCPQASWRMAGSLLRPCGSFKACGESTLRELGWPSFPALPEPQVQTFPLGPTAAEWNRPADICSGWGLLRPGTTVGVIKTGSPAKPHWKESFWPLHVIGCGQVTAAQLEYTAILPDLGEAAR